MIDKEILEALNNALKLAVAASNTPTLPIAFEDVNFIIPNDQKYIEAVFVPNNPDGGYWGDERDYMGMFRIILHWPKSGGGAYTPMAVLASVVAYFTKSAPLAPLRVTSTPNFMGKVATLTDILYPASLRYQRFQ